MSDNISDIASVYQRHVVSNEGPQSFGLFCIPEYPEHEAKGGMWSAALDALLTTLRYLAPATLLTLFWGQPSLLFRILRHIDLAVRGVVVSGDNQTKSVLQWLSDASTVKVDSLDTLWRQGWLLCEILDSALPGTCAGHSPSRLSLLHAQTIADHYLGVDPVFTRQELETQESLSRNQEWKLVQYLERLREALAKVPLPVSKPPSQRNTPEILQTNLDYIAQGSGLTVAPINQKIYFKVYPCANQCMEPGDITILIKGPRDTYGMKVIPPILAKAQQIRQTLLNLQPNTRFTETVLPITQGTTYLRSYGKNDMNKTYYIPKTIYDIDIEVETSDEFVRVGYIVNSPGKYEINVTTRGQHIGGSPFRVTATKNIIGVLAEDTSRLENGEEIDVLDTTTDRKVILRIVDFVTEKMLLNENGSFEKITEDEAKKLMSTEKEIQKQQKEISEFKTKKFLQAAQNVILITRTCKIFMLILKETKVKIQINDTVKHSKQQSSGIPDIVNSTLYESQSRPSMVKSNIKGNYIQTKINELLDQVPSNLNNPDKSAQTVEITEVQSHNTKLNNLSIYKQTSPTNPFLDDLYTIQSNNRVNNERVNREEINNAPSIFIEEDNESISPVTNPFYDPEIIERPKTPVLKIITGEVEGREDSVYFDPDMEKITQEIMGNEFINPFFMHQHITECQTSLKADFLIGAPVSLPPRMRASTPEPDMESIFITSNDEPLNIENNCKEIQQIKSSFPITVEHASMDSSTFRSLDSNNTDMVEDNFSNECERNLDQIEIEVITPDIRPRRELWDSAYVSIDDANSSPDSNENSSACETPNKDKIKDEELTKLGPAEKELWETCTELSHTVPRLNDEIRSYRWDVKRPIFTPIIEESDRSLSTGLKESEVINSSINEDDPIAVAFADLKDVFLEYASNSEENSISNEEIRAQHKEPEYSVKCKSKVVESASENMSDTTRLEKHSKGTISEVQANVTESTSVSQILQDHSKQKYNYNLTEFGEIHSNIVLEKKKYWDDKIRNTEEAKAQEPKLKKLINKKIRNNDSLTKRRGKQIVENFLSAEELKKETNKEIDSPRTNSLTAESKTKFCIDDANFVSKWKRFWNDNQEDTENNLRDTKSILFYKIMPKPPEIKLITQGETNNNIKTSDRENTHYVKNEQQQITTKEVLNLIQNTTEIYDRSDLSEEVFKAFETSPKRFFGRSRKQILNKIDKFLGQTNTTDKSQSLEDVAFKQEKGIVSRRISLFHSISEEVEDEKKKSFNLNTDNNNCQEAANSQTKSVRSAISPVNKVITDTEKSPDSEITNKITVQKHAFNNMKNKLSAELAKTKVLTTDKTTLIEINKSTPIHKRIARKQNDDNKTEKSISRFETTEYKPLKKTCISKSEMDIYTKLAEATPESPLDRYKSYEELPRTNVKRVITMYESVSRSVETKHKPISRQKAITRLQKNLTQSISFLEEPEINTNESTVPLVNNNIINNKSNVPTPLPKMTKWNKILNNEDTNSSVESLDVARKCKFTPVLNTNERAQSEEKYISLSDIDLEIVENPPDQVDKMKTTETITDYQSRFKMAKQFFQSLEELRPEVKKPTQNECQLLLERSKTESLEKSNTTKVKKLKKSSSLPSSEFSKLWKDYQDKENELNKPIKISEKFNVDGLFSDVTEGKLSRQGSLRGIPHKKAVLETFKSMENVNNTKVSPYELAVSQLTEFAKENKIKNSQTHLSEYPYLPTTDPSKYHSRLDTKASGLISMKELLNKPRRNSFPDLRLDPKLSVDL